MQRQHGQALVVVLVVTLVLQISAWAFLSGMFTELRLVGGENRGFAALHLADGGLRSVLWSLENDITRLPDTVEGGYQSYELGPGTFAVENVETLPGGLIAITVRGEVAGTVRRVKAWVRAGPEALGYGLFVQGAAAFENDASTYILPCRARATGCRRGGHLAAAGGVQLASASITINGFRGDSLILREGVGTDMWLLSGEAADNPSLGLVDIVLAGDAQLRFGAERSALSLEDLHRRIRGLGVGEVRYRRPLRAPRVDRAFFEGQAEANSANAALNLAASRLGRQQSLRTKTHSRYTDNEFNDLLDYLQSDPSAVLQGIIVVEGGLVLREEMRVTIRDGALIVQGDIEIAPGARLEIRHREASPLPGLIVLGQHNLLIEQATVIVDGLVVAGGDVHVLGGLLDVEGAVVAQNYLGRYGTAAIRYDPAVLSTVGLRRTGRGLAELISWQAVP